MKNPLVKPDQLIDKINQMTDKVNQ